MSRRSRSSMILHDFYCMNCGQKGIGLMRKSGAEKERFHKKKLYCPFCRVEVNHVECKSLLDVEEFRENFENGIYEEEAKESILKSQEDSIDALFESGCC